MKVKDIFIDILRSDFIKQFLLIENIKLSYSNFL